MDLGQDGHKPQYTNTPNVTSAFHCLPKPKPTYMVYRAEAERERKREKEEREENAKVGFGTPKFGYPSLTRSRSREGHQPEGTRTVTSLPEDEPDRGPHDLIDGNDEKEKGLGKRKEEEERRVTKGKKGKIVYSHQKCCVWLNFVEEMIEG